MATTYAPNGDTITTTYDGGSADSTDYVVSLNGEQVGRITLYKGGAVYSTPTGATVQRFSNSRTATDYLVGYATF